MLHKRRLSSRSTPKFNFDFPAKRLHTEMDWKDLVLDEFTTRQIDELQMWVQYSQTLISDWGMGKKFKPGYTALFHGPSGTGKTLTACLLGKEISLDVYKVDLSLVISKYIGETEKNLKKKFLKAENKNWILFFDEADALFGKRTSIKDAHDKYANQEVAYLLHRIEDYPQLVIFAINSMNKNVDQGFIRRMRAVIEFKKPGPEERLKIWSNAFSPASEPPTVEELKTIALEHELSGAGIVNAVQFASLMALNRNKKTITVDDLLRGIKKEMDHSMAVVSDKKYNFDV